MELNDQDYGRAWSLGRYFLARGRKGLVQLIKLSKIRTEGAETLRTVYGLMQEELLRQWKSASERALWRGA